LLFVATLTIVGSAVPERFEQWPDKPLLKDLLVAIAARDRMRQEYTSLFSAGRLNHRESSDFSAYLAQLDLRIAQQCLEIAGSYPRDELEWLPCRAETVPDRLSARLASERTTQEELAALDASLASELAEFDEKLLIEQQKAAAKTARSSEATAGEGGEGGDASGRDGAAGTGVEGREGKGVREAGDETFADQRRGAGGGVKAERRAGGKAAPEDIAEGSDDDVVARQLREAAQKESDPELKRRLWDEYRRYKSSTR